MMLAVAVLLSGLVFFGLGLGVGLYLKRQAQGALEQPLGDVRRQLHVAQERAALEQRRLESMVGELASARAALEQVSELKASLSAEADNVTRLEAQLRDATVKTARLESQLLAERQLAQERAAQAEVIRAELHASAARLVDEKGKQLAGQNEERLEKVLAPVREQLKEFGAAVTKTYDQENRDRASLLQSLKQMQETQNQLHKDALDLTKALTGEAKTQGDWGEMILERLFETAGLAEGREYALQVDQIDAEGRRRRPDALVYLPANRAVVVDAKCSLTAFVESARLDGELKERALDAHLASVRGHVRELAQKSYQDMLGTRTLDLVLMFVPNEAAFHAALSLDHGLYDEAFRQQVVICSPTTLLSALHMIRHVWRAEKQNTNALKIAEQAGRMVDKLSAFVNDLDDVGTRLAQAQNAFAEARQKLSIGRGNVLDKAKELVSLGARAKPASVQLLLDVGAVGDDEDPPPTPAPPSSIS
jgi:DNA recombination protein RmuC